MQTKNQYTNLLRNETSPYLLQHADNPVDWHPWGPQALEKARDEDKPILLSVGYSACHWCHVMAHESFEDADSAALMNQLFVNIKVDREERPDLDKIYQTAHSLLTQRAGGWPLTMFLTPEDQIPFFGGTYFPRESRHGLPAFQDLLHRVAGFYRENRQEIGKQNESVLAALDSLNRASSYAGALTAVPLDLARQQLESNFDSRYGGFGKAPKFPHPSNIERLLRHWAGSLTFGKEDKTALGIVTTTLKRMAAGGVYDQLAGGFCRYSVDDFWMIPHFEKMLYDNGPLLALYSQAFAATGDDFYRRIAQETGNWVMHEMQSPEGAYYSTLDADSEGEEGKFYVWTPQQVQALLNDDEYGVFARRFGLDREANFEGHWHLHTYVEIADLAEEFSLSVSAVTARIDSARKKLLAARSARVWPGRDEKILTSWNGLMIKGMAIAARHLQHPPFAESAQQSLDFIRRTLWQDGRLLATYKDGRAHLNAYLDDYVFLIDGILELLQVRWRAQDLEFAQQLAEVVLQRFSDPDGGFFFTADDHENLIHRPKPLADDATPSGNGVAAYVLARLGHLLGENRYLDAAEETLKITWQHVNQSPQAFTSLLLPLEEYLYPLQTVILRGDDDTHDWHLRASKPYAPRRISLLIPSDAQDLPGIIAERRAATGPVAYVCSGTSCKAPVTDLRELDTLLQDYETRPAK